MKDKLNDFLDSEWIFGLTVWAAIIGALLALCFFKHEKPYHGPLCDDRYSDCQDGNDPWDGVHTGP